jgi:hypothetical protein
MEAFALLVAQGSALNAAYRETHDVGERCKPATVNNNAHALAKRCATRIRALQAAIAERVVISAAALRMRQLDIATAESLVHVKRYQCRYCPTDGKHYAWIDADEFCDAAEEWYASKGAKPKPTMLGGFTFDAFSPPNPLCKRCRGVGEAFLYGPVDTTALEGAQAAAYAGASIDARTGTIEIHQHNQQDAAKFLATLVPGAIAPKQSVSLTVSADLRPLKRGMSVEEALQMIESITPTDPDPSLVSEQ